ncbi:multidrug effflux MFS transporter [soil metagenome]
MPVIVTVLAGLGSIGTLSTNILLPSLPTVAREFGVTTAATNVILMAFFAAFALSQLIVGPLSDRYGRRKVVLAGLVVFAIGSAVCFVAGSLPQMVVGRVVQALGASAASVLARAIARDLFTGADLGRVLSFVMIAMAAAPGFSPLLGGVLEQSFGWRSAFVFVGAFGLLLAAGYALALGETNRAPTARLDLSSMASGYWGLAKNIRFVGPSVAVALMMGGLFAFFSASPAVFIEGFGLSPIMFALVPAAMVFVVFGAGMVGPRLARRFGAGAAVKGCLLVSVAGGAGLWAAGLAHLDSMSLVIAATTLFLFGMGAVNPLSTAIALAPFGDRAGLASALLGFFQMAGAALGAALALSVARDPVTSLGLVLGVFSLVGWIAFRAAKAD